MTQLVQLVMAFAACACLALAMNRHHRDVNGSHPTRKKRAFLHTVGGLLLVISYVVAGVRRGWGMGSVEWFCIFGLSAGCCVLLLNYRPTAVPAITAGSLIASVLLLTAIR